MRTSIVAGMLVILSGAGLASADHNGHEFETAEQCMQSGGIGFTRLPRCSRSGDGPWVAQYGPMNELPGSGGLLAGAIIFALLWAAAPAAIAGMIASGRGQSVGLAVALGLVLGWIGLIIVHLTFKPEIARAARTMIDSAGSPPRSVGTEPRREPRARLEELDRLKRENLITEHEYARRRAAILEDI